jgi:hypothetical protein
LASQAETNVVLRGDFLAVARFDGAANDCPENATAMGEGKKEGGLFHSGLGSFLGVSF